MLGLAAYLQANPHACDTADGIGAWWLPRPPEPHALVQALQFLVAAALLERLPASDGRARYRRRDAAVDFEHRVREALAAARSRSATGSLH